MEDQTRETAMNARVSEFFTELQALEDKGEEDGSPTRRALQSIVFDAIEGISQGNYEIAATYLEALDPVRRCIRRVFAQAQEQEPLVEALGYAHVILQVLEIADRALHTSRVEMDLRAVTSDTKRAVLAVLDHPGQRKPMSRGQVHKALQESLGRDCPSDTRVGQILAELHGLSLVTKTYFTIRGGTAAHYHLTPNGRALCNRLLSERAAKVPTHTGQGAHQATAEHAWSHAAKIDKDAPEGIYEHLMNWRAAAKPYDYKVVMVIRQPQARQKQTPKLFGNEPVAAGDSTPDAKSKRPRRRILWQKVGIGTK